MAIYKKENGDLISTDAGKIVTNNFSENEPAKSVPEIHAHWIIEMADQIVQIENHYDIVTNYRYICSNCKTWVVFDDRFIQVPKSRPNYCLHCGAKMDEKVCEE